MSGIVGIVNLNGAPVDWRLLRRLTDFMAFRGPDAQEIWIDGHVGFGHTMLRTTSESEREHQPCSVDGEVWITADARVDARRDLIEKLELRGHRNLDAASDAELILHAYHAWREDCVQHLMGDFSFAIWDRRQQQLFCARDHFGVKPFYYAHIGNHLVLSNTLNCVRLHPVVSDKLNDLAIADFLLFGQNKEPTTTSFFDIQRLPPAHYFTWSNAKLRLACYWTLPTDGRIRYRRDEEYVEHFKDLLNGAIDDRLRTDRIAVAMSGGLDSTTIAASAKELLSRKAERSDLRAFTIVYDRLIPDEERHYSSLAAQAVGIPIQYLAADDYKLYGRWDHRELRTPEPQEFPLYAFVLDYLAQIADHSRVLLRGDGGDPVLLFSQSYFANLLKTFQFGPILRFIGQHFCAYGRLAPLGFRTTVRKWMGRHSEWKFSYPIWINDHFAVSSGLRERLAQINSELVTIHCTRPEAYKSLTAIYWANFFEQANPGVTGISVEARYPFFDVRLVNYLLAIPPIPWCVQKELLRVAMRGLLPEQIRCRPKTPLRGDAVTELMRSSDSSWMDRFQAAPQLTKYVDRCEIPPICGGDGSEAWLNSRPLSLNYWLRSFETNVQNLNQETFDELTT